ncbi:hypothetical protein CPC08DRAFT_223925 [Agrocybe pediades]|nr:hypothetical protein CPC08DRAFT_223925 [Agrocybe pediades]
MAFFARPQSTAVRIAKPTSDTDSLSSKPSPRKDSVQRQCRNIVIHGFCKFQDKGCIYYHPPPPDAKPPPPASPTPAQRTTSPSKATLTAQAVNAPVFVPKFSVAAAAAATGTRDATPPPLSAPSTSTESDAPPESITLAPEAVKAEEQEQAQQENGHEQQQQEQEQAEAYPEQQQQEYDYHPSDYENYDYQVDQAGNALDGMQLTESNYYEGDQMDYVNPYHQDLMETSYYHAAPVFLRQPLNYLLYTPITPKEQVRNPVSSHFVPTSPELRQILQERGEAARNVTNALPVPEELQGYHTLVPLEPMLPPSERKKFGNWHSTVYKATRVSDGIPHVLRRIENFRLTSPAAFQPIETWSQIQHPGIIPVREAFTTKSFNDNSLVVSYAYYPNSKTLFEAHMKPKPAPTYQQTTFYGRQQQQQQQTQQGVPERILWSYIVQIGTAIKKVHERGLAVRVIDPSKILLTGQNRVRISSCGILDVLLYGTPQPDITYLQMDDLAKFGKLIFSLATNSSLANQNNLQKTIDHMKKSYSIEIQTIALYLCSKMPKTIDQVLDMMRPRIAQEHDEALMANDRLENELMGELENARLFRLMCKFGFINERPEFARDARWSETGDRYIIKLFRDYVFHQVDEHGNPVLDLSHVLMCLNKVDAGTDEQLMLVARDEQSCLVVSYKDIKACIANAFDELARGTTAGRNGHDVRGL